MFDILKKFEDQYSCLKKSGLQVEGLILIDPKKKKHVISISKPFIFDNRKLPKKFEGLEIKSKIQGDLPEEFKINRQDMDWQKKEFVWSPERFEKFVDRCSSDIRKKLNSPEMTREEMLDAICFGSFKEHTEKCDQMIKEGKIPVYKENARKTELELV
jgi:hypothetical protein